MHLRNPRLYRMLQRCFGEQGVIVVAGGEAMQCHYELPAHADRSNGRRRLKVTQSGEEFRVNCPFCHDTRQRLFINHRWGNKDEKSGSRNLFLMQCFNENCQNDFENRRRLYEMVYAFRAQATQLVEPSEPVFSDSDAVGQVMSLPGDCLSLEVLAETAPDHPAVTYLVGRRFDPAKIARCYNVSYCTRAHEPRLRIAQGRLIIPIHMDGQFVGWQARRLDEAPANSASPKYFTSPGMKRSRVAYNYDRAILRPTVLLVEGPIDVWGAGPCAMGVLGKTMSPYLRNRLVSDLDERAIVLICLDPQQSAEEAAKGRPHHIEVLYEQLASRLPGRLGTIYLPEGEDPGSLDRHFLWKTIRDQAQEQGLVASRTWSEYEHAHQTF